MDDGDTLSQFSDIVTQDEHQCYSQKEIHVFLDDMYDR